MKSKINEMKRHIEFVRVVEKMELMVCNQVRCLLQPSTVESFMAYAFEAGLALGLNSGNERMKAATQALNQLKTQLMNKLDTRCSRCKGSGKDSTGTMRCGLCGGQASSLMHLVPSQPPRDMECLE